MPRLLFEKSGNGIWISHLDLMRVFQRTFKRAGLPLTHTQGFNPRPSVSIALPLSVGVESCCELLDFDLDGVSISCGEIRDRLNRALTAGVRVLDVYETGAKIKFLTYLDCRITLEYDQGIPCDAAEKICQLLTGEEVVVEKKGKNGPTQQNIAPMIRTCRAEQENGNVLDLYCRICCQNPSLNPMLIVAAIEKYLPELKADFAKCARLEIFDSKEAVFR